MVRYGPCSRSPCAYLRDWDSPRAITLMARRLGPSGLRSKMASSSSTSTSSTFSTSSAVRELQSLENVFLKVIPESTREEVTQIQGTWVLVIEINNMHSCLYTELKVLTGGVENKYAGYNFLTRIQNSRNGWFWYHLLIIWLFEVRTCVLAMLKTVRLVGWLYECSLKSKFNYFS